MMLIRSFTSTFIQYGILELEDNSLEVIKKNISFNDVSSLEGSFSEINGSYLIYFHLNNVKNIIYKKVRYEILDTYAMSYKRLDSETCQIKWMDNDHLVLDIIYGQKYYGVVDRIGWIEEEEDYNFGLYLYNIMPKE